MLIGKRFQFNGRPLTIVGSYEGGRTSDDAPGYHYQFDDEPVTCHWINASAVPVRFGPLPAWPANDREWARVNQPLTTD